MYQATYKWWGRSGSTFFAASAYYFLRTAILYYVTVALTWLALEDFACLLCYEVCLQTSSSLWRLKGRLSFALPDSYTVLSGSKFYSASRRAPAWEDITCHRYQHVHATIPNYASDRLSDRCSSHHDVPQGRRSIGVSYRVSAWWL